ncbi:Hypothetical predicted protein [Paramuricea clavata]|uniref:Uncharacterized protein n=1 Tax=Paramuricea clavata TaxID=317549 RepID=A0A6S7H9V1_PARCT|nr:Hypothetical predicted protein [Paramuricea clavata]
MATAESEDELFEAALRDAEEAAKPQPKKKQTVSKSQTESKRKKLLELSKDGLVEKSAGFIRKSNKNVIDKLYDEYENQRMSCASYFLSTLIISKFASVLGSFNAVESSEKLSEELLSDKLLKDDVVYLTRTISPNIPFIGLISGGCTTAKHVANHKWKKEEVSKETKRTYLITYRMPKSENRSNGETPAKEQSLKS